MSAGPAATARDGRGHDSREAVIQRARGAIWHSATLRTVLSPTSYRNACEPQALLHRRATDHRPALDALSFVHLGGEHGAARVDGDVVDAVELSGVAAEAAIS